MILDWSNYLKFIGLILIVLSLSENNDEQLEESNNNSL